MRIIESCPRCGDRCDTSMASMLEEGEQICIPCAEEELLTPSIAKKKIKAVPMLAASHPIVRNRKIKSRRIRVQDLQTSPKKKLTICGTYTAIHFSHPCKPSIAACAYERYSKSVLTTEPSAVTCLNCLKILRESSNGTKHTP